MRVLFIRHGARRAGESDPSLTSRGHQQAREAALWVRSKGVQPVLVVHTSTRRTAQTADEVSLVFPNARRAVLDMAPETVEDWEILTAQLPDDGDIVVVGHHPTVGLLLGNYGPPPVPVPLRHHASALLLEGAGDHWRITQSWPGS